MPDNKLMFHIDKEDNFPNNGIPRQESKFLYLLKKYSLPINIIAVLLAIVAVVGYFNVVPVRAFFMPKIRALMPKTAIDLNGVGVRYLYMGEFDKAKKLFEKALKKDFKLAEAHNNLGMLYYKNAKLEEAIKEYRLAIQFKPDFATAYGNLGVAYFVRGKIDEAVVMLKVAIKFNPNNAEAYNNMGVVLMGSGRSEKSIDYFRTALKIDPDNYLYKSGLNAAMAQDKYRLGP